MSECPLAITISALKDCLLFSQYLEIQPAHHSPIFNKLFFLPFSHPLPSKLTPKLQMKGYDVLNE